MSGFQKVALPLGILIVLSGIAGLVQTYFFKPARKTAFQHPVNAEHFVEAGGVRFRVPAGYVSKINSDGQSVELASEPSNFSNQAFLEEKVRMGKMDFWLQSEAVSKVGGERMRALRMRYFETKSFRHFADRPCSLAGQSGSCSEYRITYGGEITYGTRVGIACMFGHDGYAGFEGTLLSADDFYHVMESAQLSKEKN